MRNKGLVTYRQIFAIVIPTILSNITVPLVGLTDLAIIGWYGNPTYLAALTVGGSVFSLVFWAFGFLRMGITGSLGQLLDADHPQPSQALIQRYMQMAMVCGISVLTLGLIFSTWLVMPFNNGDPALMAASQEYVSVRLWSAPFTLLNYVILGVLVCFGQGKWLLITQMVLNLSNIALSWLFGWVLGWEITGVALGSVVAEILAVIIGVWIIHRQLPLWWPWARSNESENATGKPTVPVATSWQAIFSLNSNIFIRTLLLTTAFAWFTRESAQQSTLLVAINGIMLKYIELFAYALDGYAYAVESMAAKAIGQRHWSRFVIIIRKSFLSAIVTALGLSLAFLLFTQPLSQLISASPAVLEGVQSYKLWVVIVVFFAVFAYLLDGLFLSATAGPALRNGMIFAFLCYVPMMMVFPMLWGNHGLWLALAGLMAARSIGLWYQRKILLAHFPEHHRAESLQR